MIYSLVNASALGYDVVRRPAAARLADVLLTALTAPPLLLWELAAAHPASGLPRREQREWLAAAALVRGVCAATPEPARPDDLTHGSTAQRGGMLADVARFNLGRPGELDRLVANELLGKGPAAADVPPHVHRLAADTLAEAAVAEWMAGPEQSPSAALTAVNQAKATHPVTTSIDLGPRTEELIDLLASLPDTSPHWTHRRPTGHPAAGRQRWAQAMHEASWAVELSGRTRPAAAAQLIAAARLAQAGLDPTDLASWIWNSVSALVAATVVGDLLPEEATDTLLRCSQSLATTREGAGQP